MTVVVVCAVSLAIGGVAPWTAYLDVLRAGTAADFVSRLNIGPASQLALAAGDPALAVRIAPVVTGAALLLTRLKLGLFGPFSLSQHATPAAQTASVAPAQPANLLRLPMTPIRRKIPDSSARKREPRASDVQSP